MDIGEIEELEETDAPAGRADIIEDLTEAKGEEIPTDDIDEGTANDETETSPEEEPPEEKIEADAEAPAEKGETQRSRQAPESEE